MDLRKGGYDDGYESSPCFWGEEPSSLVVPLLDEARASVVPRRVLDLGCGEGKNAFPFARLGSLVDAIDCSRTAIQNGRARFGDENINWQVEDVTQVDLGTDEYDIIIVYGLLHCLHTHAEVADLISRAKAATKVDGVLVMCAFNDGPHDLSAHPGFRPLLLPDDWYVHQFSDWSIEQHSNSVLHETHPHNSIPHFHSLTRIRAKRAL